MRLYDNTRPSHGVAFKPWADRVKELLDEKELEMPEKDDLISYYQNDLSYEEVSLKVQFKTTRTIRMDLYVRHNYGEFTQSFHVSEQAKDFFKKFPELRKRLDKL